MLIQLNDAVFYLDEKYQFVGDSKKELPMLEQFGIQPGAIGFFDDAPPYKAEYTIQNGQLYLTALDIFGMKKPYPTIGDEIPDEDEYSFIVYRGLLERLPFTGTLVIGKPFIRFTQSIYEYEILLQVNIVDGQPKQVNDFSIEASHVGAKLQARRKEYDEQRFILGKKQSRLFLNESQSILDEFYDLVFGTKEWNQIPNKYWI